MTAIEPIAAEVVAAIRSPELFPHRDGPIRVVETHISWVFLTEDRAYKLRKPVVFPFLDYGTAERRHAMCDQELRLGRRLAPHLYLGLRALVADDGHLRLAEANAPGAREHVVEMRRFDEDRTLAALLEANAATEEDVRAVARVVARFHLTAEVAPAGTFGAEAVAATLGENFATLLPYADALGPQRLAAAQRFASAFAHGRRQLMDRRSAAGWVRDCHGDLRAEHVILGDAIEVFDPLEFDPALRRIDVLADLAFLAMDLVAAEREDLARALVEEYRKASGEPIDESLLWFYACYRAWVRAKVECLRGHELREGPDRERHLAAATALGEVGERLAWRARRPLVLAICGASATGKTTLARELAAASGLPHLDSDTLRKELVGVPPHSRAPAGAYDEQQSLETYGELGARAAAAPGGATVDATFRRREHRSAFFDGYGDAAPGPLFVECVAPTATVLERARLRQTEHDSVSDATPEIARRILAELEPLDEVSPKAHLTLRTDRPVAEVADDVAAALDARLARGQLPLSPRREP